MADYKILFDEDGEAMKSEAGGFNIAVVKWPYAFFRPNSRSIRSATGF
jgi:hypothetical protein